MLSSANNGYEQQERRFVMDIRPMQYYLAVVREGTISAAAQALHVAQPSLSRQMKELEDELGVTLFVRGNRKITLTEEGMVLRKRAEEMVRLMQMTEEEISQIKNHISGSVRIGAGESWSFHYLSRAAASIAKEHPDIRFHITSGDTQDLMDELNNGLIDFAVIFTNVDHTLYQSIEPFDAQRLPSRRKAGDPALRPQRSSGHYFKGGRAVLYRLGRAFVAQYCRDLQPGL